MTPLRAELATFHADESGMKNPTVLSVGEARGHGFYIDEKSIDQASRILVGKSLKSYLNHDTAKATKRTGEEIGYLSRFYREGDKLRAGAFEYFDTFKRQAKELYEKLAELTTKIPDALGFSPVISYRPVWVMADGSERDAELGEKPPAGATRAIPSARILDILSADIVGKPAVNVMGFLSANEPLVDADAEKETAMSKELEAKVASLEAQVATLETVTKERDTFKASLESVTAERDATKARVAELETKIADSEKAHSAALEAKDKAHNEAVEKLKGDHKAALEEKDKRLAEAESMSAVKLGVPPAKIAQLQHQQGIAALSTPEEKLAFYEKLPMGSKERIEFGNKHWADLCAADVARKKLATA